MNNTHSTGQAQPRATGWTPCNVSRPQEPVGPTLRAGEKRNADVLEASQDSAAGLRLSNVPPANERMPSQKELNLLLSVIGRSAVERTYERYHLSASRFGPMLAGQLNTRRVSPQDEAELRALLTGSCDPDAQAKALESPSTSNYIRLCFQNAFGGARCPERPGYRESAAYSAPREHQFSARALVQRLRGLCADSPERESIAPELRRDARIAPRPPLVPSLQVPTVGRASDPRLALRQSSASIIEPSRQSTDPRLRPREASSANSLSDPTCALGAALVLACNQQNPTLQDHLQALRAGKDLLAALTSDLRRVLDDEKKACDARKAQLAEQESIIAQAKQMLGD